METPNIDVKKILYATDLSENARHAFAYALNLANLYGAGIVLLHVLPEVPGFVDEHIIGYISGERWQSIKDQHFTEARDALIGKRRGGGAVKAVLDRFCEKARDPGPNSGTADEVVVEKGNPVEQILRQADEKNCDLIVMGTHGIGSLADAMIGSTARRVLRRSKKPVLVIPLPE